MIKNMTCIVCPIGCQMEIELDGKTIKKVTGNTCKRGEKYAIAEIIEPRRVLTTTVKSNINNKKTMIPVKTKDSIPKELLFEAMKIINKYEIKNAMSAGSVIISNILNTGVDVVMCDDCL